MTTGFAPIVRPSALAIGLAVLVGTPLVGQERAEREEAPRTGLRAALLADLDVLQEKYSGLAGALNEHYAWRPAEGVRSVSEVFMHVAGANIYLPVVLGVAPPEGMEIDSPDGVFERMGELEQTTDPSSVRETLRTSVDHARHVIETVPEEEFEEKVQMFGQMFTKRQVLIGMITHMHEHLGQMVAYARMNGVVPPWSEGG